MENFKIILTRLRAFLETPLFKLGEAQITLLAVLYFFLLLILLVYISGKGKKIINRVLARRGVDLGVREATGSIVRYLLLFIGLLVILQTVGIDLTALSILTGAFGLGIGFGLQNIASNFISRIIILFERPVRIGDRIAVGEVEGDITRIGARSTSVLTNDNIDVTIPNSKLITENVVNWTHRERKVRFRIPVSVSYDTDVRRVEQALLEAAKNVYEVLEIPAPADSSVSVTMGSSSSCAPGPQRWSNAEASSLASSTSLFTISSRSMKSRCRIRSATSAFVAAPSILAQEPTDKITANQQSGPFEMLN